MQVLTRSDLAITVQKLQFIRSSSRHGALKRQSSQLESMMESVGRQASKQPPQMVVRRDWHPPSSILVWRQAYRPTEMRVQRNLTAIANRLGDLFDPPRRCSEQSLGAIDATHDQVPVHRLRVPAPEADFEAGSIAAHTTSERLHCPMPREVMFKEQLCSFHSGIDTSGLG
jgi:hypothetical protein